MSVMDPHSASPLSAPPVGKCRDAVPGRSPRELLGAVMGDVLFVVLLFTVIFGGVLLALLYGGE